MMGISRSTKSQRCSFQMNPELCVVFKKPVWDGPVAWCVYLLEAAIKRWCTVVIKAWTSVFCLQRTLLVNCFSSINRNISSESICRSRGSQRSERLCKRSSKSRRVWEDFLPPPLCICCSKLVNLKQPTSSSSSSSSIASVAAGMPNQEVTPYNNLWHVVVETSCST